MLGLNEDNTTSAANRPPREYRSTTAANDHRDVESDSESIESIPEISLETDEEVKERNDEAPAFQEREGEQSQSFERGEQTPRSTSYPETTSKTTSASSQHRQHRPSVEDKGDASESQARTSETGSWATTRRVSHSGEDSGISSHLTSHDHPRTPSQSNYEMAVERITSLPAEDIENLCRMKPVSDSIAVVAGAVCILVGKKPSWKNATMFLKDENFRAKFKNANPLDISEKNANVIKNLVDQKDLRNYRPTISEDTHNPAEIALLDWSLCLVDDVLSNKASDSYNYLEQWKAPVDNHSESGDQENASSKGHTSMTAIRQPHTHSSSEQKSENKLKTFKEKARKGVQVYKFGRLWMSPKPRTLTYDDSEAGQRLFWKDPNSPRASDSSIRLLDITQVERGGESSIVDKYAKKRDRPRCLGIQTTSRDLAFQFESEEERNWFAEGLNLLLREAMRRR
eukprot:gb/GECG01015516.1/.p1 GENE.gb/GECG01015516.1/~~gb/GECG01015516.1/.p1  ORF type:complete len:456 (+),score=60.57 gb/GECG01015516.1/:1-1368(+)